MGNALKRRLLSFNDNIVEINSDQDITLSETFDHLAQERIDHIFHLAGKTFVPKSWETPKVFYETNVMGTVNVLEYCRKKVIPLTYVSAYLYGLPKSLPTSEEAGIQPNNPYAHSKYLRSEERRVGKECRL